MGCSISDSHCCAISFSLIYYTGNLQNSNAFIVETSSTGLSTIAAVPQLFLEYSKYGEERENGSRESSGEAPQPDDTASKGERSFL